MREAGHLRAGTAVLPRLPVVIALMALLIVIIWGARHSVLAGTARLLVTEDALAPAEIIVASNSTPQETAFEAAVLYHQHVSARIVMAGWPHNPLVERIRALGIPSLDTGEMSLAILERSGVPASAITVLPGEADGTGAEMSAVASFVAEHRLTSVLVITARSHTARTKWLLQRKLDGRIRVAVRSARHDRFSVEGWWREREQSRELLTEYLRWANTLLLPNFWGPPRQQQTAALSW